MPARKIASCKLQPCVADDGVDELATWLGDQQLADSAGGRFVFA
jgi:hypothetical protein